MRQRGGMAGWLPARLGALLVGAGAVALSALALVTHRVQRRGHESARLQRQAQDETGRLEALVRERTAQLTELAQHLQTVREDERQRLARDLHDELGALLTSAKLDTARIRARLQPLAGAGAGDMGEVLERLVHLNGTLDQVIALKRRITEDLRPSALAHLGLVAALEILAREVDRDAALPVHCALQAVPLAPAAELTVYRLVQEAVNNALKHARAQQLWLTLQRTDDGAVCVEVRDDGVGFDPRAVPRAAHGLVGMRYRVEAAQGSLSVDAAPGRGTVIKALLPAAEPARAGDGEVPTPAN